MDYWILEVNTLFEFLFDWPNRYTKDSVMMLKSLYWSGGLSSNEYLNGESPYEDLSLNLDTLDSYTDLGDLNMVVKRLKNPGFFSTMVWLWEGLLFYFGDENICWNFCLIELLIRAIKLWLFS